MKCRFGARLRVCTVCGTFHLWQRNGKRRQQPNPYCLQRRGRTVSESRRFSSTPRRGGEPLREWLRGLPSPEDRKLIGEDIKTVEFGWPVGMPVCRSLGGGICEIRTHLTQDRIARVLFYIDAKGRMVLLHGFIKKTQKTPLSDLELARKNKSKHERGLSQ
jgi:phage-related protein